MKKKFSPLILGLYFSSLMVKAPIDMGQFFLDLKKIKTHVYEEQGCMGASELEKFMRPYFKSITSSKKYFKIQKIENNDEIFFYKEFNYYTYEEEYYTPENDEEKRLSLLFSLFTFLDEKRSLNFLQEIRGPIADIQRLGLISYDIEKRNTLQQTISNLLAQCIFEANELLINKYNIGFHNFISSDEKLLDKFKIFETNPPEINLHDKTIVPVLNLNLNKDKKFVFSALRQKYDFYHFDQNSLPFINYNCLVIENGSINREKSINSSLDTLEDLIETIKMYFIGNLNQKIRFKSQKLKNNPMYDFILRSIEHKKTNPFLFELLPLLYKEEILSIFRHFITCSRYSFCEFLFDVVDEFNLKNIINVGSGLLDSNSINDENIEKLLMIIKNLKFLRKLLPHEKVYTKEPHICLNFPSFHHHNDNHVNCFDKVNKILGIKDTIENWELMGGLKFFNHYNNNVHFFFNGLYSWEKKPFFDKLSDKDKQLVFDEIEYKDKRLLFDTLSDKDKQWVFNELKYEHKKPFFDKLSHEHKQLLFNRLKYWDKEPFFDKLSNKDKQLVFNGLEYKDKKPFFDQLSYEDAQLVFNGISMSYDYEDQQQYFFNEQQRFFNEISNYKEYFFNGADYASKKNIFNGLKDEDKKPFFDKLSDKDKQLIFNGLNDKDKKWLFNKLKDKNKQLVKHLL